MHPFSRFRPDAELLVFPGDCLDLLSTIPNEAIKPVVASPPRTTSASPTSLESPLTST